ncbi:MAG: family intrarane metalloprotease [Nocardioidaceae bacterium]|nr:family intrarane metalloprotease [Nocardioidaceae bacterium]
MSFLDRFLSPSLRYQVERDHRQSPRDFRRRQVVTVVFVLIGGSVLALSLQIRPGSSTFILSTLGLAAVWAVGAFASGPLHLGRIDVNGPLPDEGPLPRPVVQPILLGLGLAVVFVVGGLAIHDLPFLSDLDKPITNVLDYADQGAGPLVLLVTVLNGIAEEMFFRGAVYAAIPRNPVVWTTVIYVIATLATGNVMLGFAAIVVGAVVGLQRRASGGILAPILTHVTWSAIMLYALPAIFF